MNNLAAFLQVLVDALAKLAPALAAYFAGKKSAKAAAAQEAIKDVIKAEQAANRVDAADANELDRLRDKWTKR